MYACMLTVSKKLDKLSEIPKQRRGSSHAFYQIPKQRKREMIHALSNTHFDVAVSFIIGLKIQ
jgi:hypothetical protein